MQIENQIETTDVELEIVEEQSTVVSEESSEFSSIDFITALVEGNNVSADEMMQVMIRSEVEKQIDTFVQTVAESAFKPE